MELVRTVKLKLNTPINVFLPTIQAYTKAYNFVCERGWKDKDRNGVSLHHKTYKTAREYLTADLTISARTKAIESMKAVDALQKEEYKIAKADNREPRIFSCPHSKQMSIRYNDKTFTISFDKGIVSLQTLDGRIKVPFEVLPYFRQYLHWRRMTAELFIRGETVYLNVAFTKTAEEPQSNKQAIGVDRGIKNIAVTSDNRFFGGKYVKRVANRYRRIRSELKAKGHSGKRHLRRIGRKENRFRSDVNHCISKQIIAPLAIGTTLVLEDLTGIRERTIKKCKREQRAERSSWAYFQLEEFLRYKAAAKGIVVTEVNARYTSQRCSKCGHIEKGNRPQQSVFECRSCGFQLHADLNASRNIVWKHLNAISDSDRVSQRT